LEFGADDAFILVPDEDDTVVLRHLKARHTEAKDLVLQFDRRCQRFEVAGDQRTGKERKPRGKLQSALRSAWDRTPPATDDADGFHGFEEFQDYA
jgi:replicative DNA helicase